MIGDDEPTFVIAEAGLNHNGDLKLALKLVDVVAECGTDAVKFQIFKADALCSKKDESYKLFKSLELPREFWEKIADFAEKHNIIFSASIFDEESADLLEDLCASFFKIAPGDLTYHQLLTYVVKKEAN